MYTYIKSKYWKHWGVSVIAAGVVGYFMKTLCCFKVPNLIAIEFAGSRHQLIAMISEYTGSSNCNALNNNTLLDFAFMVAYSFAFYFSGRILSDLLELGKSKWQLILFVPMLLDMIENFALLFMIKNHTDDFVFTLFYLSVRLKWLLVIPAALLLVTVTLYQLYVGIDKVYCWWIEIKQKQANL